MSKADCSYLADKIVARIKTWGTRSLSYAGRVQLINSVLLNLHSYWSAMFLLPKTVIDEVIAICRNYLWSGKPVSSKSPPIAWDFVCKPKMAGGLGFKESHIWNYALLGKYIWSIASKEDNLWVKWINHIYLKNRDWKTYTPSSTASWYWRHLCKIKDKFRSGYSLNKWIFKDKGYTASNGYEWLRGEHQKVDWAQWVWNRLSIPKCSFITWMVMWRRLNTKDRLCRFGLATDGTCSLCQDEQESVEHLFFRCKYSQLCMDELNSVLGINNRVDDLSSFNSWIRKPMSGRFKMQVVQSCYVALIYHIWLQRNAAIWKHSTLLPTKVAELVKKQCFWRISSIIPKKTSARDREWLSSTLSA